MADDVRNTDGRSRSRKKPAGAPVMTNRAALRVLKDLASKKTWYMLGNELGFRVEDINKKNYPWPSDFGCNEYCAKFQEYAKSEHTSPYAALIAVRESLIESNAYTPEVKALVDNVRPDSDEAMCEAALRRLMETIIETALPYNKVPKPAQGEAVGGEASSREAGGAEVRPTAAVAGEAGDARWQVAADDAGTRPTSEAPGEAGDARRQAAADEARGPQGLAAVAGEAGGTRRQAAAGEAGDARRQAAADGARGPQGLTAAAGEAGDARWQVAADDDRGAKSAVSGDMAEQAARVVCGAQGLLAQACPAAVTHPSGVARGAQVSLAQTAGEIVQAVLSCGGHNPSDRPWPGPEAFLLDGRDRQQTLRSILPGDVFALVGGTGGSSLPRALVQRLCSDSGLACRAMQRACSALAANPGVDAGRIFAEMEAAFVAADQGAGDASGACAETPGPDTLGHSASASVMVAPSSQNLQLKRQIPQARTLFLRYADADAGRALLCCTLLNLLGAQGFVRVMTCPATRELFER